VAKKITGVARCHLRCIGQSLNRFRLSLVERSLNRLLEMHVRSFNRLTPVEPDPLFQSSFDVFYIFFTVELSGRPTA